MLKNNPLLIFLLLLFCCFGEIDVYAQETAGVQENQPVDDANNEGQGEPFLFLGRYQPEEELILTFIIDKYILGEVFSIITQEDIAFDFESFNAILEFPIEPNQNSLIYEGWYITPSNRFSLDASNPNSVEVQASGNRYQFTSDDIFYVNDILYISSNAISKIFGVTFNITPQSLEARIQSEESLPVLQRIARQGKSTSVFNRAESRFTELERGYGIWSPQILDIQTSSVYRSSSESLLTNYSLMGARDIALVHTNFFLSGNDNDYLTNARMTLSKESLDADLLGPLKATVVEFGDVRPVRQGVSQNESLGFRVENKKLNNVFDIQSTNITGPVQIGWDVELYRNGTLIDQQFDIQRGQYEFLDVPLIFGENEFEIVMYSPQGEVLKDTKTVLIDKSLFESDNLQYAVSLTDSNRSLFNIDNIARDADFGYQFSSDFRKSFGGKYLVGLGLASNFGGEIEGSSLNLSLNTYIFDSTSVGLRYSVDNNGNFSTSLSSRVNLFDQPISFSAFYSELQPIENFSGKTSISGFNLSHNTTIPVGDLLSLSSESKFRFSESNGFQRMRFENSLSTNVAAGSFSLITNYGQRDFFDRDSRQIIAEDELTGALSYFKGFGPVNTRFGASYSNFDEFEISNLFASVSWNVAQNHRINLDYSDDLISEFSTTTFQYGFRASFADVFTNASIRSTGDWEVGATLRLSISGQDFNHGQYIKQNRFMSQTGNMSVRVFNDINLNGRYDNGEEPLQDVEVLAVQHFAEGLTDESGIAVLTNLPNHKLTDITVNTDTLPDFAIKPLVEGVAITFRRGITDTLDFPVAFTKEVEGTVYQSSTDGLEGARSVPLLIKDDKGRVIAKPKSEYDGFYLVTGLFKGRYTIEVDPEYISKRQLKPIPSKEFIVDVNDDDYLVFDFEIAPYPRNTMYYAEVGRFENFNMLKLYQIMLKKKLSTELEFFYTEENGKSILVTPLYVSIDEVKRLCQSFVNQNMKCLPKEKSVALQ